MRVERMRQAILQGVPLDLAFAKPALPMMPGNPFGPPMYPQGMNLRPAGAPPMHHGGPPMNYGNFGGAPGGGRGNHQHAGRGRGLLGEFGSKTLEDLSVDVVVLLLGLLSLDGGATCTAEFLNIDVYIFL